MDSNAESLDIRDNVCHMECQLVPMRISCKESYNDLLVSGLLFHYVGLFICASTIVMSYVTRPYQRT